MRHHVLSAFVLCSISLGAIESDQLKDEPSPFALCATFEQFLEAFVGLFKKETPQEGIESIEEMTKNLLKTAFMILGGYSEPEQAKRSLSFDYALQNRLTTILIPHARTLKAIKPSSPVHQSHTDDDNQKRILLLFAGIVKNFFNIVQDPENRDTVIPNLMGMASGIVEIGGEAMKGGLLHVGSSEQEINEYVANLDRELKRAMLIIALNKARDVR